MNACAQRSLTSLHPSLRPSSPVGRASVECSSIESLHPFIQFVPCISSSSSSSSSSPAAAAG